MYKMLFKKILTLCNNKPNNKLFLTAGTTLTSKVTFQTSTQKRIQTTDKWDVFSAVCLERHPIITKPMQDVEKRYQEILRQIEVENSLMSDFEMQIKEEKRLKQKQMSTGNKTDIITSQTVQDFEDFAEEELKNFKFAPRITEVENEVVSLNRKLDKHLMLLVEQRIGNSNFWIPPQTERKDEETMIQAAQRTVQELCGNDTKVKFYGNAPIGFYQYKYPKHVQDKGRDGAKVFYFLAKYISGEISSNVKHCWLDREELKKSVHPMIHKSLSQFILPD